MSNSTVTETAAIDNKIADCLVVETKVLVENPIRDPRPQLHREIDECVTSIDQLECDIEWAEIDLDELRDELRAYKAQHDDLVAQLHESEEA
jgi:hypothetical protein